MIATLYNQPRRSAVWFVLLSFFLTGLRAAPAQQSTTEPPQVDRSEAYYHYTLAHLYEQLAEDLMRREYLNRAVEEYQTAIKADPESSYIRLQLVELYANFNRLDDAEAEAEKILAEEPRNLEVRRVLGDSYQRYAIDPQRGIDQSLLSKAIEQYEQILQIDPEDKESLLRLSRLYVGGQNPTKAEESLKTLLEIEPGSAEGLTRLGFLYLDMGDPERAIEQLEKVRQAGQADRMALGGLAKAYEQTDQNEKAAQIYEQLAGEGGNAGVMARHAYANSLMMSGRYDEALEQYELLSQAEPRNPENHLRLSQIYRAKRRFDDARASLQRAAELAGDSQAMQLEVKYNLVMLLENEGKSSEAIEAMSELIRDTEKDSYSPAEKRTRAAFYEQLGILNRSEEHIKEAVDAFHKVAELDEDSRPRALVQIIDTYRSARDFENALDRSKAAIDEFPNDRGVVSMRATVLSETGDTDSGAEVLRKLLDGGEQDREILLSLAQVYEKGDEFGKAIEAVQKAQELAENDQERIAVWFTYGSVLERGKRYEEAEEKFQEILSIDPDNAAALNYLGYMLADLDRRLDDAHDMIQKALDADPDNGAYLDSLGWVYYKQERYELAERLLLRSLEQFKRDPVVHSHLGDVYYELGRNERAKEHWERSLEEWERSPKADRDPAEIKKVRDKLSQLETKMSSAEPAKEKTVQP